MLPSEHSFARKSRSFHTEIAELPFSDETNTADRKIVNGRVVPSRYSFKLQKRESSVSSLASSRSHPWDKKDDFDEYLSDSDDSTVLSSDYEGSIDTYENKRSSRGGFVFSKIHSVRKAKPVAPPSKPTTSTTQQEPRISSSKRTVHFDTTTTDSMAVPSSELRKPLHIEDKSRQARAPPQALRRMPPLSPRGPLASRRPPPAREPDNAPTPRKSNTAISYTNRFLAGEKTVQSKSITSVPTTTYEVDTRSSPMGVKKTVSARLDAQFEQDSWSNGEMNAVDPMEPRLVLQEEQERPARDLTASTLQGTISKLRAEASIISALTTSPKKDRQRHSKDVQELMEKMEKRLAAYKTRSVYYKNEAPFSPSIQDTSVHSVESDITFNSWKRHCTIYHSPRTISSLDENSISSVGLTDIFSWSKSTSSQLSAARRTRRSSRASPRRMRSARTAPMWTDDDASKSTTSFAREAPMWTDDDASKSAVSFAREAPMWTDDDASKSAVSFARQAPMWTDYETKSNISFAREAPMWTDDEASKSVTSIAREAPMWREENDANPTTTVRTQTFHDDTPTPEKDYRQFFAQLAASFNEELPVGDDTEPYVSDDKDYLQFFAELSKSQEMIFEDSLEEEESWRCDSPSPPDSPTPPSVESSVSDDSNVEPIQFSASLEEAQKAEAVSDEVRAGTKAGKRSILRGWTERFSQY
jgi:hypothetical protein